jgi:hypothetical protein
MGKDVGINKMNYQVARKGVEARSLFTTYHYLARAAQLERPLPLYGEPFGFPSNK